MHVVSLTFTRQGALAPREVAPPAPAAPFLAGAWIARNGELQTDPAIAGDPTAVRHALLAALLLLLLGGTPTPGEA